MYFETKLNRISIPCITVGQILTHTFTPHAHLDALLVATVLALVAMVLIDRAVATASTRVAKVSANGALEEGFATYEIIGIIKMGNTNTSERWKD